MPISDAHRAERAWAHIQRKPTSLVFTRPRAVSGAGVVTPETALAAQTVRVNLDNRASIVGGTAGLAPTRAVVIYGVIGHPSSDVADCDIQEGYTFTLDGELYRVVDLILVPGGVQATAVTTG